MAWVPPGTLRAARPPIARRASPTRSSPAQPVEMGGFYIDLLPYPNEPGAIPTTNVTRDEAEQLCTAKGKRLCTELEWERACKGPENATYEYGDAYRAAACGTGVSPEEAARRPSGEHAGCKSGFGVADMHGGVWEWTDSAWGRGSKDDVARRAPRRQRGRRRARRALRERDRRARPAKKRRRWASAAAPARATRRPCSSR